MPDHPGFELDRINGRAIVRLRVRLSAVEAAGEALQLPAALRWRAGDPAAHWLGPDQWLLSSDTKPSEEIINQIDQSLSNQLYAATDTSSAYAYFALKGTAARTLLAMGCGIDTHPEKFATGQCVRTNFANLPLFIVVAGNDEFDLYVDRSYAKYLNDWFASSSQDPITRDANYYN